MNEVAGECAEITMFKCHVCGNEAARAEFVSEVFLADGRRVLVEHIPPRYARAAAKRRFRGRRRRKSARSFTSGE